MKLFNTLFSTFTILCVTSCSHNNQLPEFSKLDIVDSNNTVGTIEIYDPQALTVLANDTKISVRGQGYDWTEGPLWIDNGQYLLFSNIPKNTIRKYSPKTGHSIYLKGAGASVIDPKHPDTGSNGLLLNNQGQLVIMQHGDRQVAVMNAAIEQPQTEFTSLANHYNNKKLNSPNDGVFDRNGHLYFTDPTYGLGGMNKRDAELDFSGVYRLSPEGDLFLLDDELTFPNGAGVSPDNKTLYVAVSDPKDMLWVAYDLNANKEVSNKRVFYRVDNTNESHHHGLPDGMAVHSSGIIFATGPEGVWLFNPQGKVLAKIKTGQLTSNCTFTTNEEYLFITADDYLMSVPLIH